MFEDRSYKRTFYSAPQSVTSLFAAFLEPSMFTLAADGGSIALSDPNGEVMDSVQFGPQTTDSSSGRYPDGSATVETFRTPSPGSGNNPISVTPTITRFCESIGTPGVDEYAASVAQTPLARRSPSHAHRR